MSFPGGIDLIRFYSSVTAQQWNQYLRQSLDKHDIQGLLRTLYSLQVGMNDLVKKKLNTDKMNLFFIRLQRSIENTIKQIVREKEPNPCDNPLLKMDWSSSALDEKRSRDQRLELFLRKERY